MNVKLNLLTALCLVMGPTAAWAAMPEVETRRNGQIFQSASDVAGNQTVLNAEPAEAPIELAQNYDFDVYIDQYGREIIVDAFTGEVVEIRPPAPGSRQYERRPSRPREFNGQVYDFS
ncbi:MAG: hypothetical protein RLO21_03980, partial [Nitratireductor sp.]